MDKIVAFHPQDMDVVAQPGIHWINLNNDISSSGLFVPPNPGPIALVGEMVSTNCSGTNATRYGTMKDYVVNLTVVLADGSVIKTRNRPRKASAGYNLNGLFAGSEGTLSIITEITLNLAILSSSHSVATVTLQNIGLAATAASSIVRSGVPGKIFDE
ncbi:FAD-linked oxidase, FAD-binding, subdomain 2 [Metarhizium rileyi]|uniref:FAD-linked oxidase, FAD-binding, subdomain 2 n=1 Tax=Metarhizium rileyi (strain RCEF 4871) TaxID=1649241 RepID=A0A162M1A0_METRR|nr:FAD-linked oxidase, FAD-binding, subdomain 2 [Metarhizium rileyi RCEF 4871]